VYGLIESEALGEIGSNTEASQSLIGLARKVLPGLLCTRLQGSYVSAAAVYFVTVAKVSKSRRGSDPPPFTMQESMFDLLFDPFLELDYG